MNPPPKTEVPSSLPAKNTSRVDKLFLFMWRVSVVVLLGIIATKLINIEDLGVRTRGTTSVSFDSYNQPTLNVRVTNSPTVDIGNTVGIYGTVDVGNTVDIYGTVDVGNQVDIYGSVGVYGSVSVDNFPYKY